MDKGEMMKARVIIAGSREFTDEKVIFKECDLIIKKGFGLKPEEVEIVSGCATGVDTIGEKYSRQRGYSLKRFPAHWKENGKLAGLKRNSQMAEYACEKGYKGILIAFPLQGRSAGTWDMIRKAGDNGLDVYIFEQKDA